MIALYGTKCTDFADGMLAILQPLSCKVKERAGGEFSLYMELPLIANGAHTAVQKGYLIRCPVPKRETPLITNTFSGTGGVPERVIYRTKNKASLRTKGYVDAPVIEWLKKGIEVLFNGTFGMINHSVVTSPSGNTGRIYNEVIEYVRTEPAIPGKPAYNSIVPARQVRDQFFRIYELERDTGAGLLRVWARHISYDLLHTLLLSYDPENADASAAITGFKNAMDHDDGFAIYSNVSGTVNGQWDGKNAIFALQDPEQGLVRQLDAQLVRDNYDIFLLKNEEIDRGFVIESGKNLKSVKEKISADKIVTRLVPYYSGKDGKRIYLPEKFVDASNVGDHPGPRTALLEVQIERDLAQEAAFLKMREACQKEFEKGVNLPDVQIEVDFISAADIEEFKHIKALQQVFLYDVVKIKSAELGLTFSAAVNEIEYDAVLDRYLYLGIGKINTVEEMGSIASYQLSSGSVSGTKISVNSVNSHHLKKLSINKAHIQNAAIESAHIAYAAIEEANIKDAAVSSAKIKAAAIDNAKISEAGIDYAKIKDLVSGTAIIEAGIGEKLIIKRLSVTDANVVNLAAGKLLVQGQDGAMYQLTVGADGTVTTIKKQIGNNDVQDESLHAGEKIIKGTIVADLLDVQEIFANQALIGAIKAQNIAAQEITVNHLAADVGRTLDLSSNESIALAAAEEAGKIDGRNLLPSTYNPVSVGEWSVEHGVLTVNKYSDYPVPYFLLNYIPQNLPGVQIFCNKIHRAEELRQGDYISVQGYFYRPELLATVQILDTSGSVIVQQAMTRVSALADNEFWGLYTATLQLPRGLKKDDKLAFLLSSSAAPLAATWFREVKLEKGRKVTPFAPSPYDAGSKLQTSHIKIDKNNIDVESGGEVNIKAGGKLAMQGATVQIEATESEDSHINFGQVFSVGKQADGKFGLSISVDDPDAMRIDGHAVLNYGNVKVQQAQPPSGKRTLWLKPNATTNVTYNFTRTQYANQTTMFGGGSMATKEFVMNAVSNDVLLDTGEKNIKFVIYLRRTGGDSGPWQISCNSVNVQLRKGGQVVNLNALGAQTWQRWGTNKLEIFGKVSGAWLAGDASPITAVVTVAGLPAFQDSDFVAVKTGSVIELQITGQGSNAAAQLCQLFWVP